MRRWTRTLVALPAVALALATALPAGAHDDRTPDAAGSACDTVVRSGHEPGHHHSSSNDREAGGVYFHNHGGHYVVRAPQGYVEIIGGQGYSDPNGNQGGWVQGEVDPGMGGVDADFRTGTFSGTNAPYATAFVCVSVADRKVALP